MQVFMVSHMCSVDLRCGVSEGRIHDFSKAPNSPSAGALTSQKRSVMRGVIIHVANGFASVYDYTKYTRYAMTFSMSCVEFLNVFQSHGMQLIYLNKSYTQQNIYSNSCIAENTRKLTESLEWQSCKNKTKQNKTKLN